MQKCFCKSKRHVQTADAERNRKSQVWLDCHLGMTLSSQLKSKCGLNKGYFLPVDAQTSGVCCFKNQKSALSLSHISKTLFGSFLNFPLSLMNSQAVPTPVHWSYISATKSWHKSAHCTISAQWCYTNLNGLVNILT